MSSKKILAASLAAVLATGAVASYAMAADDEYTVVIDGTGAGDIKDYTLSLKTGITSSKFAADYLTGVAKVDSLSKLGFSSIKVGLWEAFSDFNITATSGLTIDATVKGKAVEFTNDQIVQKVEKEGVTSYEKVVTNGVLPKFKDGVQLVVGYDNANDTYDETNGSNLVLKAIKKGDVVTELPGTLILVDADTTGANPVHKKDKELWDELKGLKSDDLANKFTGGATIDYGKNEVVFFNAAPFGDVQVAAQVDVTATAAAKDLGSNWQVAKAAPTNGDWGKVSDGKGKALGPVTLEPKFTDLSDTKRLVKIGDVEFSLTGDITVDSGTYKKYVKDNYFVDGAAGNWNATQWSNDGNQFINKVTSNSITTDWLGLGIVASSTVTSALSGDDGAYDATNNKGWDAGDPLAKLSQEPKEGDKGDLNIAKNGQIDLSYYGVVNPNVLKNLNNGGTVTFTYDKDVTNATVYGYVRYYGADGWHIIDADDSYTISGKTVTFNFPAGLTYHPELKDSWHPFLMQWNLEYQNWGLGGTGTVNGVRPNTGSNVIWDSATGAPSTDDWGGKIVSIKFEANKEGSADAPSIGGDGNTTSTPSDGNNTSNGGNTTTNPGTTSGNPNTGIALAVAPVVLAAGAVVTLVSKKRK